MVCIGICIILFANLLLRLDESNTLSIVTSISITWNKKSNFFLSTIVCLSNRNTNPISISLDKRSSCLKYSFTSLIFWLAEQKHILDHYCTAKLLFGKEHTKNSSLNQFHESTQVYHICVKDLVLAFCIFIFLPRVQSLLWLFSFIYTHFTCNLNWQNASFDLTLLCTHRVLCTHIITLNNLSFCYKIIMN